MLAIPRFSKSFWKNNEDKFVFDKTIRLLALNFYEVIVNSGFAHVNYHLIEISISHSKLLPLYAAHDVTNMAAQNNFCCQCSINDLVRNLRIRKDDLTDQNINQQNI